MTSKIVGRVYISLGILFVALVGSSLVKVASSQRPASFLTMPSRNMGQKESRLADQRFKQNIPTAYYDGRKTQSATAASQGDSARRAKGARYEKRLVVKDVDTGGGLVLGFSHWDAALPALPAERSALVVLGEVVDAKAYLSNDQTGVYSEFAIRIERIFKNDKSSVVCPGELLTTERLGGRVIFPSGRSIIYGNRGQGMPEIGQRYVFFLERNPEQYNLLTAYQLRSGEVQPLDGRSAPGGENSEWDGNAYRGMTVTQFLHDVESKVAKSLVAGRGRTHGKEQELCSFFDSRKN